MIVPTPVPFSTLPDGGVFQTIDLSYQIKVDATSQVNLATGALSTGIPPDRMVTYFVGATLLL